MYKRPYRHVVEETLNAKVEDSSQGRWELIMFDIEPAVHQSLPRFPAQRDQEKRISGEKREKVEGGVQVDRCLERMAEQPNGNLAGKVTCSFNQQEPSLGRGERTGTDQDERQTERKKASWLKGGSNPPCVLSMTE
ncbi:hypothetical protein ABVT39_000084 [Epinephelus coioides]